MRTVTEVITPRPATTYNPCQYMAWQEYDGLDRVRRYVVSTPQKPTQRVTEWRWRLFIQTHGLQWDPESETYQAQENQQ